MSAKKTTAVKPVAPCQVSRDTFVAHAQGVVVKIGDYTFFADPKTFSTGSLGWNVNAKMPMLVDGKAVMCQVGLNLTVIGSKDAE
jgi:hypothetical protein